MFNSLDAEFLALQRNFTAEEAQARPATQAGPFLAGPSEVESLARQHEVVVPVFLPAIRVGFGADRFLLAVADGFKLARAHATLSKGLLSGTGATRAHGQVVLAGTTLIAVALHLTYPVRVRLEDLRSPRPRLPGPPT